MEIMEPALMNPDTLLFDLCQSLLADDEVVVLDGWSKVVLAGGVDGGSASLSGFCFDAQGGWDGAAPRNRQSLALMRQLNAAMADEGPDRRPWVACLIVMGANGKFTADFEYKNPARWSIGPSTHEKRLAEFAALPIPGGQSDSQL
jgi:hypothetical protein